MFDHVLLAVNSTDFTNLFYLNFVVFLFYFTLSRLLSNNILETNYNYSKFNDNNLFFHKINS